MQDRQRSVPIHKLKHEPDYKDKRVRKLHENPEKLREIIEQFTKNLEKKGAFPRGNSNLALDPLPRAPGPEGGPREAENGEKPY